MDLEVLDTNEELPNNRNTSRLLLATVCIIMLLPIAGFIVYRIYYSVFVRSWLEQPINWSTIVNDIVSILPLLVFLLLTTIGLIRKKTKLQFFGFPVFMSIGLIGIVGTLYDLYMGYAFDIEALTIMLVFILIGLGLFAWLKQVYQKKILGQDWVKILLFTALIQWLVLRNIL